MTLSIGTLDRKIWSKDLILVYLYHCLTNNKRATIDMLPEGSCAIGLGLYELLDQFCDTTGYPKSNVTIKTANMLEQHSEYRIIRDANSWYEISSIQEWLSNRTISTGTTPSKHFANFSSRTNWSRLWIATILDTYYSDKTLQTYLYDQTTNNYNPKLYTGIDDLIRQGCDMYIEAAKFIGTCPRTLDMPQILEPIQHPENLKLLDYYHDIFLDVVVEPNVHGNCLLVTEKLWRCIIARRPFIVMSNKDYLSNLRKLGFRTFDQFWSEEYDSYAEADRIRAIHTQLDLISTYKVSQLTEMLDLMNDILEHNYNTFIGLTAHKVKRVFYNV
jgi:hypothetical protein